MCESSAIEEKAGGSAATTGYPLWLFETGGGYKACGYNTTSYCEAVEWCEEEFDTSVLRAERVRLPLTEYRALMSVNRESNGWPEAYSALIGVFLDAYWRRNKRAG